MSHSHRRARGRPSTSALAGAATLLASPAGRVRVIDDAGSQVGTITLDSVRKILASEAA